MIKYIEGDIFESPAQVIVNTVNTVGVMGKGLAFSFKQRYPKMFEQYKAVCEKQLFTIGNLMLVYEIDHWILLFPTKESWRKPSKLEYIEKGLEKFVNSYADKNITSIAFPRLGCGNGELDWNDVKPIMEKYLNKLPIDVYIYLGTNPDVVPEHKEPKKTMKWLKENAKDMSFNGVRDDLIYLSSLAPYIFTLNNQRYEMSYFEKKVYITIPDTKQNWEIKENRLYRIWDDIRMHQVFSASSSEENEQLIYGLLHSAGYLSKIKLFDSKLNVMEDGYQINAGLGRVLALKGH